MSKRHLNKDSYYKDSKLQKGVKRISGYKIIIKTAHKVQNTVQKNDLSFKMNGYTDQVREGARDIGKMLASRQL